MKIIKYKITIKIILGKYLVTTLLALHDPIECPKYRK